jgi:hypothetical protein
LPIVCDTVPQVTIQSVPPQSRRVADSGSILVQVGALLGFGAGAALACTAPAMLRVSAVLAGDAPVVRAWAALSAAALGPMMASIVVLRAGRYGLRVFAEPGGGVAAFGVAIWLAMMFVSLALFGGLLSATTHLHALAAVTFASGALVIAVGGGLTCARVVALLRASSPAVGRWVMGAMAACAVVAVASLGARFARVVWQDPASAVAAATVADVVSFGLAATAAALGFRSARRALALVGPPVAVFLAALGITILRDAIVRQAIDERAPAFAPAVALASGHR